MRKRIAGQRQSDVDHDTTGRIVDGPHRPQEVVAVASSARFETSQSQVKLFFLPLSSLTQTTLLRAHTDYQTIKAHV